MSTVSARPTPDQPPHGGRVHSAYTEPHSTRGTWTSPPLCHVDEATARARVAGVTALAGPAAAHRRTWIVEPCDGTSAACPPRAARPGREPALTPTVLALLDFYAALEAGADPGPFPVRSQHLARTRAVLIARGLVLADVPTGGRIVTAPGRELVARRAAVAARQAAR